MSNYYLAAELKERAISNKNRRSTSFNTLSDLQLRSSDFGVTVLNREQMAEMRAEVEQEMASRVGQLSAKQLMEEVREHVLTIEAGGERHAHGECWNTGKHFPS